MTIPESELAALEAALAAGPTPGPWRNIGRADFGFGNRVVKENGYCFVSVFHRTGPTISTPPSRMDEVDAAYIAAAHPDVIAKLLAHYRETTPKEES